MQTKAKQQAESVMAAGWWSERFAREDRLKPLAQYLDGKPSGQVNEAEALKAWARRNDAKFKKAGGADG